MNDDARVAQARRWLEEQLVGLAGLRNAQSRDPAFKHWRQNTLTVLQRIWPDDAGHSENFRRIPFSMPGNKTTPKAIREWYSRGCTDAAKVLRMLLEEVDTVGVPDPSKDRSREIENEVVVGDYPTLDLASGEAESDSSGPEVADEIMLDLGAPSTPIGAATASMLDRGPDEPLPPTLKVAVPKAAPLPAATSDELPVVKERVSAQPIPKRRASAKPSRKERTRGASRQKLKDMLGLARFEAVEGSAAEPAAAATPATPTAEAAAPTMQVGNVEAAPPKRRSGSIVDLNSMIAAEFRDAPAVEPRRTAAKSVEAPVPANEEAPVADEAPAPAIEQAPMASTEDTAESSEDGLDPEAFARATEAFLLTSPVLGSTGRPVQRVSDGTSFMDPDAVAVASLASEVGRLSVPEPQRASLRAHLMGLARQLETGELEWALLRESVTLSMEHPELARRLMPILLPWLDRAA